jgi:hypothetical protein
VETAVPLAVFVAADVSPLAVFVAIDVSLYLQLSVLHEQPYQVCHLAVLLLFSLKLYTVGRWVLKFKRSSSVSSSCISHFTLPPLCLTFLSLICIIFLSPR